VGIVRIILYCLLVHQRRLELHCFARELPPRSTGFNAENRLYLFALTMPRKKLLGLAIASWSERPLRILDSRDMPIPREIALRCIGHSKSPLPICGIVPGGAFNEPPQSKDYRGQIMISRGDKLWTTCGAGAGAPSHHRRSSPANRFLEVAVAPAEV
jgi:hypothetical protein